VGNNELILNFIKQFENTKDLFSNGMCYYFSTILKERFKEFNPIVMYNPVDNHFAVSIKYNLYDVNGIIEDGTWRPWDEYQEIDPTHANRIIRDCILKLSMGELVCGLCSYYSSGRCVPLNTKRGSHEACIIGNPYEED
jgi:hypothetical protein